MKHRKQKRIELGTQTLERAQVALLGSSNDTPIQVEFASRGIVATPRVDTFTYNAWLALGRQVRRGERGVKGTTWIPIPPKQPGDKGTVRPQYFTVFHVSQTDPIQGEEHKYDASSIASRRAKGESFALSIGA